MARKRPAPIAAPASALDELEVWMTAPAQDTGSTLERWAPVASLVHKVAQGGMHDHLDPFLVPLA